MNTYDDDALDRLLGDDFLSVPQDFSARLLQRAAGEPQATNALTATQTAPHRQVPRTGQRLLNLLRWLGLIGGGALALSELLAFIFGLWSVTRAF